MKQTISAIKTCSNERVFAYLRVSGTSQIKGDGFTRQAKAVEEYARANKLTIVQTYREEGVSGTLSHRPTLAEMLLSLKQNGHGVKTVIIEKLDRLARDLMVQEYIVQEFTKPGFNIISTMEGADLCGTDPSRKLIRQIMGAFAEYDKVMLVMKLRAARERIKAKTGKCGGRKGYADTDQGRALCKRIVELRRNGLKADDRNFKNISEILNSEGVLTIDGKQWTQYRVQQTVTSFEKRSNQSRKLYL